MDKEKIKKIISNENLSEILKNTSIPINKKNSHEKILWLELEKQRKLLDKKYSKKNKITPKPVFKLAFSFSLILFFLITGSILFSKFFIFNSPNIYVTSKNGSFYKNNKMISPEKKIKINNSDIISTDKNSECYIKIIDQTLIELKNNSEISLLYNAKIKNNIINRFYLQKGSVFCDVNLPAKDSIFEIYTDFLSYSVKGTKFSIDINNEQCRLIVNEGIVEASNFFRKTKNIETMLEKQTETSKIIGSIINKKINVKKDNFLIIDINYIYQLNKDLDNILNELNKNNFTYEEISLYNNKLLNIKNQSDKITQLNKNIENQNDNIQEKSREEKSYEITKLDNSPGINFTEKNTAVTSDNKNIYITSDSNSSVYCIDPSGGNLIWKFSDPSIKAITQEATSFKNYIIFSSPNQIFVLNKNGQKIISKTLDNSINYWPKPIVMNDNLYIPALQTIYNFDGNNFNELNGFEESMGQLFTTGYQNNIYGLDLNSKYIFIYDIDKNENIKISTKLKNRSFTQPVITNKFLFTADIDGNIYKYNFNIITEEPKIISTGIEIYSSIVYNKKYIYFIANNGYFYRIDTQRFNSVEKIKKIDIDPYPDKYLTKKLILLENKIYFSSDNGKLFIYNTNTNENELLNVAKNNIPLIGSPVLINNSIFVIDKKSHIYRITKK